MPGIKTRTIAQISGAQLATIAIGVEPDLGALLESEQAIFQRLTADLRRREWWCGRIAARAALEALGASGLAILADERGVPTLAGPRADEYFVAISHGRRLAAAIAAH